MTIFTTHNTGTIDVNGSYLQGRIDASYSDLCRVFGKPTTGDSYKTDANWNVLFQDGHVATIYNYKDGINYNGTEDGTPTELIRDWHIGGFTQKAVDHVQAALAAAPTDAPEPSHYAPGSMVNVVGVLT